MNALGPDGVVPTQAASVNAPPPTDSATPALAPSGATAPSRPSKTPTPGTAAGALATATPSPPTAAPAGAYKIGPQDVLDVSVFKVPELSTSVTVADSGTINLPLVGEIQAVGRTPQEVQRELTQKLGAKYLQSPQVTVAIKEYNSQTVTVDGAVKKPGVLPYRNSVSLLQVITLAGGLDADSDSTVVVFRQVDGKRNAARFDVSEIRSGSADDPQIKPGDVVVAGSSAVKAAFNNFLKALPVAGMFMAL